MIERGLHSRWSRGNLRRFEELLNYPPIARDKGHEWSMTQNSGAIGSMIKKIKAAVKEGRDVWDDIHIILLLECATEEYDALKKSILSGPESTVQSTLSIPASEELRIRADREVGIKPDKTLAVRRYREPICRIP